MGSTKEQVGKVKGSDDWAMYAEGKPKPKKTPASIFDKMIGLAEANKKPVPTSKPPNWIEASKPSRYDKPAMKKWKKNVAKFTDAKGKETKTSHPTFPSRQKRKGLLLKKQKPKGR